MGDWSGIGCTLLSSSFASASCNRRIGTCKPSEYGVLNRTRNIHTAPSAVKVPARPSSSFLFEQPARLAQPFKEEAEA